MIIINIYIYTSLDFSKVLPSIDKSNWSVECGLIEGKLFGGGISECLVDLHGCFNDDGLDSLDLLVFEVGVDTPTLSEFLCEWDDDVVVIDLIII